MVFLPEIVNSGLELDNNASRSALASIGEVSRSWEEAPSKAIFSAIADSITPGRDTLSSERMSRRS